MPMSDDIINLEEADLIEEEDNNRDPVPPIVDHKQIKHIRNAILNYKTEFDDGTSSMFIGLDEAHQTYLQVMLLSLENLVDNVRHTCFNFIEDNNKRGYYDNDSLIEVAKVTEMEVNGFVFDGSVIVSFLKGFDIFNAVKLTFVEGFTAYNESRQQQH